MKKKIRYVISVDGKQRNFLSIEERKNKDLIISVRGKKHCVPIEFGREFDLDYSLKEHNIETHSSFTVHHNPNSKINSITLNCHRNVDDKKVDTETSYIIGVKKGCNMVPVMASIGRKLNSDNLLMKSVKEGDSVVNLWEGQDINSNFNSVAYLLAIANPDVDFAIPKEFPRNNIVTKFERFQIVLFYWLFNKPVKLRGTSVIIKGYKAYSPLSKGLELHEILNFTNELTKNHLMLYDGYPDLSYKS